MRQRIIIAATALVALLVIAYVIVLSVHWVNRKDTTPDRTALRQRLDRLEHDRLIVALQQLPHSTESLQERLTCQPAGAQSWNLRIALSGGVSVAQTTAVLDRAASFGWAPGAAGTFSQTTTADGRFDLTATTDGDSVVITVDASAGLSCQPAA